MGVARPLNLTGTQSGGLVGKLIGRLIGLTGNIGSGKSTVAQMFAARGIPVIDADGLARELQAPGQPAHTEIAAAWPEVVGADGRLDRRRLSNIVFADSKALKRLEAMMHPRIQTLSRARWRSTPRTLAVSLSTFVNTIWAGTFSVPSHS